MFLVLFTFRLNQHCYIQIYMLHLSNYQGGEGVPVGAFFCLYCSTCSLGRMLTMNQNQLYSDSLYPVGSSWIQIDCRVTESILPDVRLHHQVWSWCFLQNVVRLLEPNGLKDRNQSRWSRVQQNSELRPTEALEFTETSVDVLRARGPLKP